MHTLMFGAAASFLVAVMVTTTPMYENYGFADSSVYTDDYSRDGYDAGYYDSDFRQGDYDDAIHGGDFTDSDVEPWRSEPRGDHSR